MKNFYIKIITASGTGKRPSAIDLQKGINIIHGASNTGKSYVIACIDFMFGSKDMVPFDKDETGYDTVSIRMENDEGEWFYAERKIIDGDNEPKADNKISVRSSLQSISDGDYRASDKTYSDVLLKLLGIEERPKIIATQKLKTNDFTIRTFFHQFFLKEDYIFTKRTIIDNPEHSHITSSITALEYLITGKAAPKHLTEDPSLKEIRKTAVIGYINGKIEQLSNKQADLEKTLNALGTVDVDAKINETVEEIETIEKKILEANKHSRALMSEIFDVSQKLEEANFLKERYRKLHSQYDSDIKRLQFIVDGETKAGKRRRVEKCPFCEHEISDVAGRESYIEASKAELEKTNIQLSDLRHAENDIADQIIELENRIKELNAQYSEATVLINTSFKPRIAELRQILQQYDQISRLQHEMATVRSIANGLSTDAFKEENEEESEQKYNAKEQFDKTLFKSLSDSLNEAVSHCSYPHFVDAYISDSTFDVVVNGKHKKNQGKGYRAYLNVIYAFTLMKFLEANAKYPPMLFVADSPILSLKEKVDVPATDSMKTALFTYMIEHCGNCQTIIAENEIPDGVDYSKAHMIEFTMDNKHGRYGFLLDVRNAGDYE
jgi:hypothetical protein